jgi:hypothetical protein
MRSPHTFRVALAMPARATDREPLPAHDRDGLRRSIRDVEMSRGRPARSG